MKQKGGLFKKDGEAVSDGKMRMGWGGSRSCREE